jgi:putative acetyltransferase
MELTDIREEKPEDYAGIERVHVSAWGSGNGNGTASLVVRIRTSGDLIVSLVYLQNGEIVGHILFSKLVMEVEGGESEFVASLAPLVVDADYQRRGIGSGLIRRGIEECRRQGYKIMVVLGHPEYYPRFGFDSGLAGRITSPFSGKVSWMALELERGALANIRGRITYPRYFNI